jgi:nucleotide-binding universal stress UspA family protein
MPKIVVGIDLSPPSELALGHAIALARHGGATVVAVMVDAMVELPGRVTRSSREVAKRYEEEHRQRYAAERLRMRQMLQRWHGGEHEVEQRYADGMPDEELPRVASELGAELIVVGSRGRTGLTRLLLGSVAEHVVRGAEQSVLVARGDAVPGGYRRVVIGTDFSAPSDVAVQRALPLLSADAHVDLVHGWQSAWTGAADVPSTGSSQDEVHGQLGEVLRAAAVEVDARRRALGHGGATRGEVSLGAPAEALIAHAAHVGADLVVVGSHGRRGVRRLLLGSVAEATVRLASCAVLVAR